MEKKQKKPMLSAFSIILILIILLGIISHFLPAATSDAKNGSLSTPLTAAVLTENI